jgi:hypothetical protein
MPKGSVSRPGQKMLKTRPVSGGAQQYVRGNTAEERAMVADKAVDTADKAGGKGRQSLAYAFLEENAAVIRQLVNKTKREQKIAAVRRPKTLAKQNTARPALMPIKKTIRPATSAKKGSK